MQYQLLFLSFFIFSQQIQAMSSDAIDTYACHDHERGTFTCRVAAAAVKTSFNQHPNRSNRRCGDTPRPPMATLAAKPTLVIAAQAPDLATLARASNAQVTLQISDLILDKANTTDLLLERFEVFAADTTVLVNNKPGTTLPNNAYFRGFSTTMPNAQVVLIVPERGPIKGLITDANNIWIIVGNNNTPAANLHGRKVDKAKEFSGRTFACSTDNVKMWGTHPPPPLATFKRSHQSFSYTHRPQSLHSTVTPLPTNIGAWGVPTSPYTQAAVSTDTKVGSAVTHTAKIAIATDYEYFAKFGNKTAALNYMGDIFAYVSALYEREINTNLQINYIELWSEGPAADPWNADTDTVHVLLELQDYWRTHRTDVERALTHMLSGKPLGGGVAYTGVLCDVDNGYGVSTDLEGTFAIEHPGVVWDTLVVAHEIGHNFSSGHTHDYCGIGGISDPVDLCYDSTLCGQKRGLPGVDSLEGGTPAAGNGTVMGYCHKLDGGMANVAYSFGTNHIYGREALRIATVMKNYVLDTAALNPTCLTLQNIPTFIVTPNVMKGVGCPHIFGCGGLVAPHNPQVVLAGASLTFVLTPNEGYIQNPTVGGTCLQGTWHGNAWTTGPITANCTVEFLFTPNSNTYIITPTIGTGGTINPDTPQAIPHGAAANFTLTANTGYTHNNMVTGTCPQGSWSGNTWTTGPITADCTVAFSFLCQQCLPSMGGWRSAVALLRQIPNSRRTRTMAIHKITPSAGMGGTIIPNAMRLVLTGTKSMFTITPIAGNTATVTGTCGGIPTTGTVAFTYITNPVSRDCTIEVNFTTTLNKAALDTVVDTVDTKAIADLPAWQVASTAANSHTMGRTNGIADPDIQALPILGSSAFAFTKLDANGQDLPAEVLDYPCLRDNATGLIWEVKTQDGGLQDQNWSYTWYDANKPGGRAGTASGGTCYTVGRCDSEKYVHDINAHALCGGKNWRLPTIAELATIANSPLTQHQPPTWAAFDPGMVDGYNAMVVNFATGHADYQSHSLGRAVMLLREGTRE